MQNLHVSVLSDFILLCDQLIYCLNWQHIFLDILSDIPHYLRFISLCDFYANCQIQAHLQRDVSGGNLWLCLPPGYLGIELEGNTCVPGLLFLISHPCSGHCMHPHL